MQFESMPPLSQLVGSQLSEVTKRDYDWAFLFGNGVTLVTESSHWRLVEQNRVIVTDEDHGQLFGLKEPVDSAKVVASEVASATVCGIELSAVSDLLQSFSNGLTLQALVGSAGYENWHVYGPDQSHTFAIGGGALCREVR